LALASGPAGAQGYKVPRTASGQPDLQGQWTNASLTHLERPKDLPTLVVTEAEAKAYEARQDGAPKIPGDDVGQDTTEVWEHGGPADAERRIQQQLPVRADQGSPGGGGRDEPRRPDHPVRRNGPAACGGGADPSVDGAVHRALGRRHACCRDLQLQRHRLVER